MLWDYVSTDLIYQSMVDRACRNVLLGSADNILKENKHVIM